MKGNEMKTIEKTIKIVDHSVRTDVLGLISFNESNNVPNLITLGVIRSKLMRLLTYVDKEYRKSICDVCGIEEVEKQNVCSNCWEDVRKDHILQDSQ